MQHSVRTEVSTKVTTDLAAVRDIDRIVSLPVWATLAGISLSMAKKLIAMGKGPKITRIERRVGVRLSHHLAWLNERGDDV